MMLDVFFLYPAFSLHFSVSIFGPVFFFSTKIISHFSMTSLKPPGSKAPNGCPGPTQVMWARWFVCIPWANWIDWWKSIQRCICKTNGRLESSWCFTTHMYLGHGYTWVTGLESSRVSMSMRSWWTHSGELNILWISHELQCFDHPNRCRFLSISIGQMGKSHSFGLGCFSHLIKKRFSMAIQPALLSYHFKCNTGVKKIEEIITRDIFWSIACSNPMGISGGKIRLSCLGWTRMNRPWCSPIPCRSTPRWRWDLRFWAFGDLRGLISWPS